MSTAVTTQPQQPVAVHDTPPVVYVYSHSPIFYWWPVWVLGYAMALLTYAQGVHTNIGESGVAVWMHPSRSLGVVYTIVFLMVILMTNFSVRGVASLTLVISVLFFTVLFAYMGIWEDIFAALGMLAIYMNMGFYVFFSSALFLIWFFEVTIRCRLDYWSFHPGQAIHHRIF